MTLNLQSFCLPSRMLGLQLCTSTPVCLVLGLKPGVSCVYLLGSHSVNWTKSLALHCYTPHSGHLTQTQMGMQASDEALASYACSSSCWNEGQILHKISGTYKGLSLFICTVFWMLTCMYVYALSACNCPLRPGEYVRSPANGTANDCGNWEWNLVVCNGSKHF